MVYLAMIQNLTDLREKFFLATQYLSVIKRPKKTTKY